MQQAYKIKGVGSFDASRDIVTLELHHFGNEPERKVRQSIKGFSGFCTED